MLIHESNKLNFKQFEMKKSFKKIGLLISTTPAFNPNYVTVEMNIIGEITRDLVVIHVFHEVDLYATYLTKHNGA